MAFYKKDYPPVDTSRMPPPPPREKTMPLTQLGSKVPLPRSPEDAVIETFNNPNPKYDYVVRFCCPEFTSTCPITGAPDFASMTIDYIPDRLMIESKSLKLFLGSFRTVGAFHEDCTMKIVKRLVFAVSPKWFRIGAAWNARGGISIDVVYQTCSPPHGVYVPQLNLYTYRGR